VLGPGSPGAEKSVRSLVAWVLDVTEPTAVVRPAPLWFAQRMMRTITSMRGRTTTLAVHPVVLEWYRPQPA
jgi:hypothetical protein